jgi:hypothetical protein
VCAALTFAPMCVLVECAADSCRASSFQLASLDDRGTLTLWMLGEVKREVVPGMEDLGLSLGGRVKLVRSRSLNVLAHGPGAMPEVGVFG